MNSLDDYGALFEKLGLTELEVEDGEFKLRMKKEASALGKAEIFADDASKADKAEKDIAERKIELKETGEAIKSPLLGIFYSSNAGNKEIKVGDKVKEGDVMCTIEAMKMMNEVRATRGGVVTRICAKDGDLVEYNQDLFIVA